MKKWIVAGFACLCLACSGFAETAMEMSGTSMEIGEDGSVTMTLPDGQVIKTQTGGEVPEDFPMPPPWEDAEVETVTEISVEGEVTMLTVAFKGIKRPKDEIVADYEAWLTDNGELLKSEDGSLPGISSMNVIGTLEDGRTAVVSITEALGQNSVSLVLQNGDNPFEKEEGDAEAEDTDGEEGPAADAEADAGDAEGSAEDVEDAAEE